MDKYIKTICDEIYSTQDFKSFNNKTVLVTGVNGLIGGMISEFFYYLKTKKGYNIKLILTSKSETANRLKHLNNTFFEYYSIDLSKNDISDFISKQKINYCFYSSGYATPSSFIDKPLETLNININGLYNTLNFIKNNNEDAKFLYISSGEIYSSNNNYFLHDEVNQITVDMSNKRNFYKIGKIAGELLINNFRNTGFNASSIRTTICYGPGNINDNRMLVDLVRKGLTEDKIQLMDDGSSTRKLIHISDFCSMIFNIIKEGKNDVYNISGEEELSIFQIGEIISNYISKPVIKGHEINNITKYASATNSMSLRRYEEEFGNHSFKSIEDGIKEFIDWYKNEMI